MRRKIGVCGARLALRIMAQATQQHQTIQSDRQEDERYENKYGAHDHEGQLIDRKSVV